MAIESRRRWGVVCLCSALAACASLPPPRAPRDLTAPGAAPKPELVLQRGHRDFVMEGTFSADSKLLATWASGDSVRLWNIPLGAELRNLAKAFGPAVALSPDGRLLASGGPDNPVTLFDTATGEELGQLGPGKWVEAAAFVGSDRIFIASQGKSAIWDLRTGAKLLSLPTQRMVQKVSVGGGGSIVAVEQYPDDFELLVFALPEGRELFRAKGSSTWAIDAAGTTLARTGFPGSDVEGGHAIELLDLRNPGALPRRLVHADSSARIALRPDGTLALIDYEGKDGAVYDLASGKKVLSPTHPPIRFEGRTKPIFFSPDGRWLLRADLNGMLVTDAGSGAVVSNLTGDKPQAGGLAFSPDGKGLLLERRLPSEDAPDLVSVLDFAQGRMSPVFRPSKEEYERLKHGARGGVLRETFRKLAGAGSETDRCPSGEHLMVSPRGELAWSYTDTQVSACDLRTGAEALKLDCPGCFGIGISPDGRLLFKKDQRLELLDVQGRRTVLIEKLPDYVIDAMVSPDGSMVAFAQYSTGKVFLYDVKAHAAVAEFPGAPEAIGDTLAFDPGSTLLAVRGEREVALYDVPARKPVARLFLLGEDDWVLVSNDGRYDGNDGGMRKVKYVAGLEVIPLDGLFERFYTPRLAAQLLGGGVEAVKARAEAAVAKLDLKPPPVVTIASPADGAQLQGETVEVRVEAQDRGAGVEEIRLYLNGKLVEGEGRGFKKAGTGRTFTVALTPGTSELKAVAVDSARSESAPAKITVTRAGAKRESRLFLLVAGVNDYKNPRYVLGYARPDAQAFAASLVKHGQGIFASVVRRELYDAQVTRPSLEEAFGKVAAEAQPEDVFVFYFAGHGVMSEGSAEQLPDFFLAPHDVVKLYGDDAGLTRGGLSSKRLKELATAVRAQKQLLVFDACQSGGAVEAFASRGAVEEKAILQLSRSAGVTVLAATGTEQLATEFKEIGHGVFTYALLTGLEGGADGTPQDGKITVRELTAYIEDQVPELTKKYRGTAQYPQSFSRGQDFPVGTK